MTNKHVFDQIFLISINQNNDWFPNSYAIIVHPIETSRSGLCLVSDRWLRNHKVVLIVVLRSSECTLGLEHFPNKIQSLFHFWLRSSKLHNTFQVFSMEFGTYFGFQTCYKLSLDLVHFPYVEFGTTQTFCFFAKIFIAVFIVRRCSKWRSEEGSNLFSSIRTSFRMPLESKWCAALLFFSNWLHFSIFDRCLQPMIVDFSLNLFPIILGMNDSALFYHFLYFALFCLYFCAWVIWVLLFFSTFLVEWLLIVLSIFYYSMKCIFLTLFFCVKI